MTTNFQEDNMTHTTTELNAAAMKNLGFPYLECSDEQREAVEASVTTEKLIALMHERGAQTIGDLFKKEPR